MLIENRYKKSSMCFIHNLTKIMEFLSFYINIRFIHDDFVRKTRKGWAKKLKILSCYFLHSQLFNI